MKILHSIWLIPIFQLNYNLHHLLIYLLKLVIYFAINMYFEHLTFYQVIRFNAWGSASVLAVQNIITLYHLIHFVCWHNALRYIPLPSWQACNWHNFTQILFTLEQWFAAFLWAHCPFLFIDKHRIYYFIPEIYIVTE